MFSRKDKSDSPRPSWRTGDPESNMAMVTMLITGGKSSVIFHWLRGYCTRNAYHLHLCCPVWWWMSCRNHPWGFLRGNWKHPCFWGPPIWTETLTWLKRLWNLVSRTRISSGRWWSLPFSVPGKGSIILPKVALFKREHAENDDDNLITDWNSSIESVDRVQFIPGLFRIWE